MSHERQEIREHDLQGFKYFKKVRRLLERLHQAGCQRDRAHHRRLHMDEYTLLVLLYLFNPICVSLRSLQQASQLKKVQSALGVSRSSLGSLSEASRVFDSECLLGLIQEVGAELGPLPHEGRLDDLGGAVVRLGASQTCGKLRQAVRIVQVECRPHRKPHKTGRGGPEQGDTILLVTDLLEVPAEGVGMLYEHRWQIEIFFRMFKHLPGCRHLLSQCPNGIELQVYTAILACLLIALYTGGKPTQRTYEMLAWYFLGWADEEELESHIANLKKQVLLPKSW
jgi:hypothetical protein